MKISKKKMGVIITILILTLCIIIFAHKSNADDEKIIETTSQTAEVEERTITTTLTAPGEVQSASMEKITLNTSYYYLTMCAESEEYVKKGDNLLKYTNGTYVTAPYDCVVIGYSVPNAKSICTSSNYIYIASVESLYMDINIGEDNINKISVGQEVDIVVNSDETKSFKGTITKINAIGTHSSGGTTFAAVASIENDGSLKLGMSATCTITIDSKDSLPCLPIESIEIENSTKYVNLVKENGETEKIEVETGVADANYVQIVSGLSLGDKVSYETTTVTIVESENSSNSENSLTSLFNMGGKDDKSNGKDFNKGGGGF